ncbi:hypothetical protein, partial [Streptomyces hydrogenans]|uniref:hypothetical protein n=1 Tax=Streptomyces hydrogenans TaxID=1873719 RepID=UPI001CFD79EE
MDITGADEATVQAAVAEVAPALAGRPRARRRSGVIPGEPGVTARMYAGPPPPRDLPGTHLGCQWVSSSGSCRSGLVIAAATWIVRRVGAA